MEPSTVALQPAGALADTIEMPDGILASTETVAWGGRSFGNGQAISVATPVVDERRRDRDMCCRRDGEDKRGSEQDERQPHGKPSCRAITIRCTSFVPSPISRIF